MDCRPSSLYEHSEPSMISCIRLPGLRSQLPARRSPASLVLPVLAVCSALLIGCGSSTSPNGGGNPGGLGTFSAVIDGTPWTTTAAGLTVSSSANQEGYLIISGVQFSGTDYVGLELYLGYIGATGAYPLGVNQGTTPGGSGGVIVSAGGNFTNWLSAFSGSEGTVTITKLTSTEMAGTFQYTAKDVLNTAADKTVTSGAFDVTLPAAFHVPAPDKYGNTITADINAAPWTGATVVGVGDLSTGSFSMGGGNTGLSINLVSLTPVAAGNTYDQTGVSIEPSGSGPDCCWGGAGVITSVTITSLTATRVAGTFSGFLPVTGGGAASGPLTITNGKFDIRIP
jgi:hypothetical protein